MSLNHYPFHGDSKRLIFLLILWINKEIFSSMIVPIDIIAHIEHHLYDSQLIGLIEPFFELIHLNRFIVIQILINQMERGHFPSE